MKHRNFSFIVVGFTVAAPYFIAACGGASANTSKSSPPKSIANDKFKGATRCDTSKPGREVSYHDLAGRGKTDMIEVLAYSRGSSGFSEGRVVCMELDTNRDGVLDLLRVFSEKGDLESEEADRNYDGKSDVWITYEKGQMVKQAFDSAFKGIADEFHYYREGKLKRIERDRNDDGKIDVWEFYVNDRLERMGVDLTFSGKVSTWYRDEIARAEQKRVAAASAPAASGSASTSGSALPKKKGEAE
ncbi:MAG: hypothetical protein NVS3B20_14130 [Polyangiales bacterium]